MSAPQAVPRAKRLVTAGLSAVLALVGIVLLIETAVVGGGAGYVLGLAFLAAGALRLYVTFRHG
jgi:hypothetical protein